MTDVMSAGSVRDLFREEIASLGGKISDEVTDGNRLFARAILLGEAFVAPGDGVNAGVALRYRAEEVEIRPYVFRRVCRNGAIHAQSARGREIDLRGAGDPGALEVEIRHAIRAAASPEAFAEFSGAMRSSRARPFEFDFLLALVGHAAGRDPRFLLDFVERMSQERAQTMFAAGNALTSLARDTADPELRWRREVAGAAVFARLKAPVRVRERSGALLQPR
jgi:hypothetical protein